MNRKLLTPFSLLVCVAVCAALMEPRIKKLKCENGKKSTTREQVSYADRVDCIPESTNPTEAACLARTCTWDFVLNNDTTGPHPPGYPESRYPMHIGIPSCYYPRPSTHGYAYQTFAPATYGFTATLKKLSASPYPNDVNNLRMDVYYETLARLRIRITDADKPRYELKYPTVASISQAASNTLYDFQFVEPSSFEVSRRSTGEVIFGTALGPLIYSDQYIQFSSRLPSNYFYGFGLNNDDLARSLNWQLIPIFSGLLNPDYGNHPFYLARESNSTNTHGVLLFTSNGMDILLQPAPAITYRVIGGVLDFYVFLGPNPDAVVAQYSELVGRPHIPPYWGLGYHLSRYNYNSSERTRQVWSNTLSTGIPYEVQWNDIDYMENYKSFTYDKIRFGDLPQLVADIHAANMKYVTIIDAGTSTEGGPTGTYSVYTEGVQKDIFIKTLDGTYASGQVWPQDAVFTDFSNPNATDYWTNQYQKLHDQIPVDGAWIDMNEPTTFTAGSQNNTCPNTPLDFPPYVPRIEFYDQGIYVKTLCMSSQQHGGTHYDLHSLFGYLMTISTNEAMKKVRQKRPFVLSRASSIGQGRFGGLWTGDVYSSWSDMKLTVPSILAYNMAGVTFTGADICGFRNDTTEELCQRWTQLGSFYSFCRNHNINDSIDQDPYSLGPNMIATAKAALMQRYKLLPFFYTQLFKSHLEGTPTLRPLFFEFTDDPKTYTLQEQFLWGSQLMAIPILEQGATEVNAYFPAGIWTINTLNQTFRSNGEYKTVPSPVLGPGAFAIRGGSIIPTQEPAVTTVESRKNKFGLLVTLDSVLEANGVLYWDDGDSIDPFESGKYTKIEFVVKSSSLTSSVTHFGYPGDVPMRLGSVTMYGISPQPNGVTVNGATVQFAYDSSNEVLQLTGLDVDMSVQFSIVWS